MISLTLRPTSESDGKPSKPWFSHTLKASTKGVANDTTKGHHSSPYTDCGGAGELFPLLHPQSQIHRNKKLGHVEVTEVDMSFRLAGHVTRIFVEEGAKTQKGEALAELEQELIRARRNQALAAVKELEARIASLSLAINIKQALSDAEIRKAQALVSAADARYQSLKTGSREEEIAEAAAARDKAKTEWENRKADYQRIKDLFEGNTVSTSQYDAARTSAEAARAAYLAAAGTVQAGQGRPKKRGDSGRQSQSRRFRRCLKRCGGRITGSGEDETGSQGPRGRTGSGQGSPNHCRR